MLKWKTLTATLQQTLEPLVPSSATLKSHDSPVQSDYVNRDLDHDDYLDEQDDNQANHHRSRGPDSSSCEVTIPSRIHGCLLISPAATLMASCHLPPISRAELIERGIPSASSSSPSSPLPASSSSSSPSSPPSPIYIDRLLEQDRVNHTEGANKVKALFVASAWAEYIRALATIPSSILVHTKQGEAFYVYPVRTGGKVDGASDVDEAHYGDLMVRPYLLLVVMAHTNVPAGVVDRRAKQVVAILEDGLGNWKFYDDNK